MTPADGFATDAAVIDRLLSHIDRKTTDEASATWREPVVNYTSAARLQAERALFRRYPTPFCPSASLPDIGSYVARNAAGTPLLAVRGEDGVARVFRNACRHRGAQVADGRGCKRTFACPYHAWTYGLDGCLRAIPHEHGFPQVDKAARGLVPVQAVERQGMVLVVQDAPGVETLPETLPVELASDLRLLDVSHQEVEANWKIFTEGFLEGYHIRATHTETFYPVQFDNLNVVETFGRNSRIAFPYRAINKLRNVPAAERQVEGKLTYVYHLFPNVLLATFPGRVIMVVLEPLDTARTLQTTFTMTDRDPAEPEAGSALRQGLDFVDAGAREDRAVVCSIQRGLASGANEFFEFGLFEGALSHFHRNLHELTDS